MLSSHQIQQRDDYFQQNPNRKHHQAPHLTESEKSILKNIYKHGNIPRHEHHGLASTMQRVVLIRHGQSTSNAVNNNLSNKYRDATLTPLGIKQAKETRILLHTCPTPSFILVSPLRRAIQTALLVFPDPSVKILITTIVREGPWGAVSTPISRGAKDVRKFVKKMFGEEQSNRLVFTLMPDEEFNRLQNQNFAEGLRETLLQNPRMLVDLISSMSQKDKYIAVVSHGAFLQSLLSFLGAQGECIKNAEAFKIKPNAIKTKIHCADFLVVD